MRVNGKYCGSISPVGDEGERASGWNLIEGIRNLVMLGKDVLPNSRADQGRRAGS